MTKKKDKTQITNITKETRDVTIDSAHIKMITKETTTYSAHKSDNLDKVDQCLEKHKLLQPIDT